MIDLLNILIDAQTCILYFGSSMILLALLTTVATFIQDLGRVNSLGGAALVITVTYICPSIIFSACTKDLGKQATKQHRIEVIFSVVLLGLGIIIRLIGVVIALLGSDLG